MFFLIVSCSKNSYTKNVDLDIDKFYIKNVGFKEFNLELLYKTFPNKLIMNRIDSVFENQIKSSYPDGNRVREYYYYSVLDTMNYYSIVLYRYHEYNSSFEIFNISKFGKIIDSKTLFSSGGDAGDFYKTESNFVNDSIIEELSIEGHYLYDEQLDTLIIDREVKSIIILKSTGEILTNPIYEPNPHHSKPNSHNSKTKTLHTLIPTTEQNGKVHYHFKFFPYKKKVTTYI